MPPIFKKDDRFKQGIFKPKNPEKFIGKFAIFRSSYERAFFLKMDNNPNVLEWGSENVIVPYKHPIDNKIHKYYVDAYVVIKEGNATNKYLIELKPSSQTEQPKASKRKKKETMIYENFQWKVNQAKWAAAEQYAKLKGAKFLILTEKDLF